MAADVMGNTPADVAKMSGHHDLANRLVAASYELTDRLSHYLCGRLPDHTTSQHFIVPEMADNVDQPDLAKAARKRLQAVNHTSSFIYSSDLNYDFSCPTTCLRN